jgi:hypothetical protein
MTSTRTGRKGIIPELSYLLATLAHSIA